MSHLYADPAEPALPATGFKLDLSKAALVVIDPQNDFLSPAGASWAVFGESIVENNTVENLEKLFKAFKAHDLPVAVSPHYYYPHDHDWHFGGPLEKVMHSICMFDRKGPNTLENFEAPAPISSRSTSRTFSTARPSSPRRTRSTARKPTTWRCNCARKACRRSSSPAWRPTFAWNHTCANCSNRALK